MSKYYGIDIKSPNVVRYGDIKDVSLCTSRSELAWFVTEESAIRYADEQFRKQANSGDEQTSRLPGIAFLYMEDKVPQLQPSDIDKCVGIGGVIGSKSATFVYCPPPGHVNQDSLDHRQFLYYPGDEMVKIVEAYDWNAAPILPRDYQPKVVSPDTVYVHYGSTEFDKDCFTPAYTRFFDLKPEDGFWASATDAQISWREWCLREHFRNDNPNCRMEFTLTPDAKVFMVRTIDDIAYLIQQYPAPWTSGLSSHNSYLHMGLPALAIDYEAMAKDYDGLDYSYSNLGNILGLWDCDSVCIFNPDVMQFRDIELLPEDPNAHYEQNEFDDIMPDEFEEEW